ncbi:MAG: DUF2062 domain-containing protein [Victivallales bacterium]|nr:DUF2062 domain-containing protein [Victivallales bacterium]MCF7889371.1 DUF2062 domain-containing protein [Victivallales bacterium]
MILSSTGSPHYISLGIGLGLFSGVAIPLGQVILAFILAVIFRANKVLALAATFITNPYTSPFLYPGLCYLGSKITGNNITIDEMNKFIHDTLYSFSWNNLFDMGWKLLLCYLVGGFVFGIVIGSIGYLITYRIVLFHNKIKAGKNK